ncbi:PucR family transcriptional regulator [Brevibacillus sp. H7]|jgi:purine catabolism regulator|uniref:PucR family transcriptional regulator n=1 Tax=Brevibacillus sp. H7 TaxID=3349138 RepID=UPI00380BECCE
MTITIREALQLPDMVQTRLVAGESGLDNQIRWVTIVEVLEDTSRLQEGEFLITTGFGLADDEQKLSQFIPSLVERKLSGVALHTGFYLREIPSACIEAANRYNLPLIEIPLEMNFSTITKAILQPIVNRQFETLAYSQAIHDRMIEAALSKGGLPAIASELAQLTGGAVTITDALGFEAIQLGAELLDRGKLSTQTAAIRAAREHYGSLMLTKPECSWKELDNVALQHAATLCALEYAKERAVAATEWRLKGDFVEELLSGRSISDSELETRSRLLGYPLAGRHLIAAVRVAAKEDANLSVLHQTCITLLKRLCDRHHHPYLLRERAQSLLLVLPADKRSQSLLEQLAAQWLKLYPDAPLHLGISSPRSLLSQLADAADEAVYALQAYPLLTRAPALLPYTEMQGYQFLYPYHRQQETLQALWHPLLDRLLEYDRKHNQQLLETLHAYLEHNCNGLKASQALYIHRHTLKYRLEQIEEKTGCNLEDAHQRWQLQLALMAFRLHRLLYPS